jgi:hypothetical protein
MLTACLLTIPFIFALVMPGLTASVQREVYRIHSGGKVTMIVQNEKMFHARWQAGTVCLLKNVHLRKLFFFMQAEHSTYRQPK